MNDNKNPGGRPTSYKSEYCDRVIELGKEGNGKAEIAAELDVHRETLNEWCKEYQEFSDAMSRARDLSLAWWEKEGRKNICNREFNANAYRLQVCNRFPDDWRDRTDLNVSGEINVDKRDPLGLETALLLHNLLETWRQRADTVIEIQPIVPPQIAVK